MLKQFFFQFFVRASPRRILSAPMEGNEPDPQLPAKRIFFVRHGEGEHNLGGHASSGYLIADAVLTAAGQVQCRSICSALSSPPPQLVVVSPLRRTMHTAMLAFGNTAPFLLLPSIMETGLMPCDCPQPAAGAAMLEEVGWPGLARQYAALGEGWDTKGPGWRASVLERFAALIELLGAREEERIAVVSHHDFLKANLGISFEPAELRAFSLCAGGLSAPTLLDGTGIFSEPSRNLLVGELRTESDPLFLWTAERGAARREIARDHPRFTEITGEVRSRSRLAPLALQLAELLVELARRAHVARRLDQPLQGLRPLSSVLLRVDASMSQAR